MNLPPGLGDPLDRGCPAWKLRPRGEMQARASEVWELRALSVPRPPFSVQGNVWGEELRLGWPALPLGSVQPLQAA